MSYPFVPRWLLSWWRGPLCDFGLHRGECSASATWQTPVAYRVPGMEHARPLHWCDTHCTEGAVPAASERKG